MAPLKNRKTEPALLQIFQTIDRVNRLCMECGVHRQKDFFILALTLIPWAEHNYQLYTTFRKGAQLFKFARIIREELDNTIGQSLNLRRSLRQEATNLLVNLAQLIHTRKPAEDRGASTSPLPGDWPKWLQRKSYFQKVFLFYQFYLEATSGAPVVDIAEAPHAPAPQQAGEPETNGEILPVTEDSAAGREKPRGKNGGRSRAAFAPNTRGGVFGLRNE